MVPIQRAVTLVGLGLPDPLALLGGVLGAEREHRSQRLVLAEHGDRPEAEVAGIHRPQLRQVQRAVRLHPLDEHGQFVHVRHDPRGDAGFRGRPVTMPAPGAIGRGVGGDIPDQIAGVVGPHVVDDGLQFAGTHGAHVGFQPARPVGPQQFLQQAAGGVVLARRHSVLPGTWLVARISTRLWWRAIAALLGAPRCTFARFR